jgi:hypothetical protein
MPRTEINLTAGRCLVLAHWHCGHASHEIVQWPVNTVVVERNVLDNAFSAIGIEPVDVGNQAFSAPVGLAPLGRKPLLRSSECIVSPTP